MRRWLAVAPMLALGSIAPRPTPPPPAPTPVPRSIPPASLAFEPLPDAGVDATFAPEPRRSPAQVQPGNLGQGAARAAADLARSAPTSVSANCTLFVAEAYQAMGAQVTGAVPRLWARGEAAHAIHFDPFPEPGDLAFFDHTVDRNGNGHLDDPLTHVAIVLSVAPDGDIWLAHGGTRGTSEVFRMYLGPDPNRNPGDAVRLPKKTDPPGNWTLARDLWRGFARVRRDDLRIWSGADES